MVVAQAPKPRCLVVLCDGTGNEITADGETNVLRLYQLLKKTQRQRVFYDPGVGTAGSTEDWARWKANTERVLGLLTGYGLDNNVLDAYRFLLHEYRKGDDIVLFGYSRGAYTVRVLAGFINAVGLLHPDQQHLTEYAFAAYKQISEEGGFSQVRRFERILRPRRPSIRLLGLWDTVSSILVPRKDRFYLPARRQLAYTERNPSVQQVLHALALDERRRMFRPYLWREDQPYWGGPFNNGDEQAQLIQQLWFPGVHSDVGGGRSDADSGLAKLSLQWMLEQTGDLLELNQRLLKRLVLGEHPDYSAPNPLAPIHDSLSSAWKTLEYLPSLRLRGALPRGKPRELPEGAELHPSVKLRAQHDPSYRPSNIDVE